MVDNVKKSYSGLVWPTVLWTHSTRVSGVGTCGNQQRFRPSSCWWFLSNCIAETWTLNTDLKRQIDVFDNKCLNTGMTSCQISWTLPDGGDDGVHRMLHPTLPLLHSTSLLLQHELNPGGAEWPLPQPICLRIRLRLTSKSYKFWPFTTVSFRA